MRSILLSALAVALVVSGCNCGDPGGGTSTTGADPNVLDPVQKVGDEFVLDFGKERAGYSYQQHIVIENLGRLDWTIDKLELRTGANASLSIATIEVPLKVATGGKLDLKVSWSPQLAEDLLSYVDISGDAESQEKISIKVIGKALAPVMKVCVKDPPAGTPECDTDAAAQETPKNLAIDFGIIGIKDPPVTKTLLIKNLAVKDDQDIRLHLTGIDFQPGASTEFTVLYPSVRNVAPEGQMEVTVTYKPVDGGYDNAVLEITGDDPTKTIVRVDLTAGGRAPRLCVSNPQPPTLNFGQVGQGTESEQEITLESCGVSPLVLTNVALGAGTSATFTLPAPPQLPMTLAPGVNYKLKVKFAPVNLGVVTGQVTFNSDAGEGFVSLTGEGVKEPTCDIQISPKSIDFGQVPLNGFADRVIFGTNVGQKTCHLTKLQLTGAAAFSVQNSPAPGAEVAPLSTFSISLRYTPGGTTQETGNYLIEADDPAEPSVSIDLKGTGKTPGPCEIQISPPNLNFGTVAAGTGKAMELFLYNFGTDQCWLGKAALTAASVGFALTAAPTVIMAQPIDSGAKVRYEVTFQPAKGGPYVGALSIQAGPNALGMKNWAVALTGVAGEAAICITPEVLDFGVQGPGATRELGFTIQSCGPGLLEMRGINLEAGTSTDYTITQKPQVPQQLAPSQTALVKVKLNSTGTGPAFGRVKVLSNDRNKPAASVVLKANSNGCFTSVLNCAPTALHFPKTATGLTSSLTFSCVSLGTVDVDLTSIHLTASSSTAFSLSHKTLPPKVKPGESFRVAVDYAPTQITSDVGTVEIASNDCQRPLQTIALDGLSKAPDFPKCIPPKVFQPVTKWKWENPTIASKFKTVWITPMVAPLEDTNGDDRIDEDDTPSVIFTSTEGIKMNVGDPAATDMTPPAVLRAVDGKTGAELLDHGQPGPGAQQRGADRRGRHRRRQQGGDPRHAALRQPRHRQHGHGGQVQDRPPGRLRERRHLQVGVRLLEPAGLGDRGRQRHQPRRPRRRRRPGDRHRVLRLRPRRHAQVGGQGQHRLDRPRRVLGGRGPGPGRPAGGHRRQQRLRRRRAGHLDLRARRRPVHRGQRRRRPRARGRAPLRAGHHRHPQVRRHQEVRSVDAHRPARGQRHLRGAHHRRGPRRRRHGGAGHPRRQLVLRDEAPDRRHHVAAADRGLHEPVRRRRRGRLRLRGRRQVRGGLPGHRQHLRVPRHRRHHHLPGRAQLGHHLGDPGHRRRGQRRARGHPGHPGHRRRREDDQQLHQRLGRHHPYLERAQLPLHQRARGRRHPARREGQLEGLQRLPRQPAVLPAVARPRAMPE
ncbi:MAG: choice-of-anchor D domain-containing protein [Myxococcales bacterium]